MSTLQGIAQRAALVAVGILGIAESKSNFQVSRVISPAQANACFADTAIT